MAQSDGRPPAPAHGFAVAPDSFSGHAEVTGNVLCNDPRATAVVRHSDPAHGTAAIDADGTFIYTPEPGFKGADPARIHAH